MNKTNLALTSLVAAVPGLALTIGSVMVFLSYGGGSTVMFQLLSVMSLLMGTTFMLMPAAIIVFGKPDPVSAAPSKSKAAAKGDAAAESSGELAAVEPESEDSGEVVAMEDDLGVDMEVDDFLEQSSVEEEEMLIVDEESSSTSDFDAFEDDEPPPPKKKKK